MKPNYSDLRPGKLGRIPPLTSTVSNVNSSYPPSFYKDLNLAPFRQANNDEISFFDTRGTINEFLQKKAKSIAQKLEAIPQSSSIVSRFYDGTNNGLQSLAEKYNQYNLPPQIKNIFAGSHSGANKKAININDRILYSPFISTTKSLPAFIKATFGLRGDTNLKHDVFHRAPMIGTFDNIPKEYLRTPPSLSSPDRINLPSLEKEILFDSDNQNHAGLNTFQTMQYNNPFQGHMKIDLTSLFGSRNLLNNQEHRNIIRKYDNIMSTINPEIPFSSQGLIDLTDLQRMGKSLEHYGFNQNPPIPEPQRYNEYFKPINIRPEEEEKKEPFISKRTGGHVTRPRQQRRSNFDMKRARQILEMLNRAMV